MPVMPCRVQLAPAQRPLVVPAHHMSSVLVQYIYVPTPPGLCDYSTTTPECSLPNGYRHSLNEQGKVGGSTVVLRPRPCTTVHTFAAACHMTAVNTAFSTARHLISHSLYAASQPVGATRARRGRPPLASAGSTSSHRSCQPIDGQTLGTCMCTAGQRALKQCGAGPACMHAS